MGTSMISEYTYRGPNNVSCATILGGILVVGSAALLVIVDKVAVDHETLQHMKKEYYSVL